MDSLRHKRVTVAGLGRFGGGIAVAKWLVAQGAQVLVTDKASAESLAPSVAQLEGLPIRYKLGGHDIDDFIDTDLLVVNPALAPTNPYVRAAIEANVPISTEIGLFLSHCRATRTVGVTGTKGKSTTSALLARMLATKHKTWFGGNIGVSLLEQLDEISTDDVVVLELSSYMLYWLGHTRWSPHVAVLTMIHADHLDWHGDVAAYHEAKANLVAFQTPGDVVVFDSTHESSAQIASRSAGSKIALPVTIHPRLNLRLPGEHNQRNAQLALAAARTLGVTFDDAQRAVADFAGLPHRMELVHEHAGVRYVNDSIATIPEAAIAACEAFAAKTVLQIVGGYDKGADLSEMAHALASRCKAILTIGKTGPTIARHAREADGTVVECGTLERAMDEAKSRATSGDVVLLSTACASYDQFTNFEHRGQRFAELARSS